MCGFEYHCLRSHLSYARLLAQGRLFSGPERHLQPNRLQVARAWLCLLDQKVRKRILRSQDQDVKRAPGDSWRSCERKTRHLAAEEEAFRPRQEQDCNEAWKIRPDANEHRERPCREVQVDRFAWNQALLQHPRTVHQDPRVKERAENAANFAGNWQQQGRLLRRSVNVPRSRFPNDHGEQTFEWQVAYYFELHHRVHALSNRERNRVHAESRVHFAAAFAAEPDFTWLLRIFIGVPQGVWSQQARVWKIHEWFKWSKSTWRF